MKWLIFVCLLFGSAFGRRGVGPTNQKWGYVEVRKGAHMFWWLHYNTISKAIEKPLIIWLQGGPGAASSGYGNFVEVGPLDLDLKPRKTAWTAFANLLLVDNPVGTGYSYVNNLTDLARNNSQIAEDFVVFMQGFYKTNPQMKKVPLYIFSESYGGKMAAEIALFLNQEIQSGRLDINFKGIGLGDPWISPSDSFNTWGPYLQQLGYVDASGLEMINKYAEQTQRALDQGSLYEATEFFSNLQQIVQRETFGVDVYNVLTPQEWNPSEPTGLKTKCALENSSTSLDTRIEKLMNGVVKRKLGINVTWGEQSDYVYNVLLSDFLKPVTHVVEKLLNETDIKIAVYNGHLDLIVNFLGTAKWVRNLRWEQSENWLMTPRKPVTVCGKIEGFLKQYDNLAFYCVLRAGHMVPVDNPEAMESILRDLTDNFKV